MKNPYTALKNRAFWKTSIANRNLFDIDELYQPKISINKKMLISSYGSCFAMHIGKSLRNHGYNWYVPEQPPRGFKQKQINHHSYDVFSARTGNIYTCTLLEQWVDWALGNKTPPDEFWQRDGRFFDPFRPNIEPDGFSSVEELVESRKDTIACFKNSLVNSNLLIFTLGLTESWSSSEGYEYPLCPGTAAGEFDSDKHQFTNQKYPEIYAALNRVVRKVREVNKKIKFLFTVSPVPLVATMSGNHVLPATIYSKSVLRAVAEDLKERYRFVDYFPSYEIINSAPFKGVFFEPNQRSVNKNGVEFVMKSFHAAFVADSKVAASSPKKIKGKPSQGLTEGPHDEHCDESILEAFGGSNE